MKVLLINGSPRENGNTFTALSEVAKTLNSEGISTEIISIGKKAVQGCIACGMCGRTGKCTFNDDLYYKVLRAVKDGIDGLIVGSPVYYGGPNGSLCALLDRVFYSLGPDLQYKPGASVVVCRRGGATAAFDRLQVLHDDEHAAGQLAVLELGLWSDTWAGSTGRGGYADDANPRTQHGLVAEEIEYRRGKYP